MSQQYLVVTTKDAVQAGTMAGKDRIVVQKNGEFHVILSKLGSEGKDMKVAATGPTTFDKLTSVEIVSKDALIP